MRTASILEKMQFVQIVIKLEISEFLTWSLEIPQILIFLRNLSSKQTVPEVNNHGCFSKVIPAFALWYHAASSFLGYSCDWFWEKTVPCALEIDCFEVSVKTKCQELSFCPSAKHWWGKTDKFRSQYCLCGDHKPNLAHRWYFWKSCWDRQSWQPPSSCYTQAVCSFV